MGISIIKDFSLVRSLVHEYVLSERDREYIDRAYLLAYEFHKYQKRESGEMYIVHPISVTGILATLKMDYSTIVSSLLHDAVEDTTCSLSDISGIFGNEIANIVDGVTKISSIEHLNKESIKAESIRKMIFAMSKDIRVVIVKLADRLSNIMTLEYVQNEKQKRISNETIDIYVPIADRLGMYEISILLSENSFRFLYPKKYFAINKNLNDRFTNEENYVNDVISKISNTLQNNKISICDIYRDKESSYKTYLKESYQTDIYTNRYIRIILVVENIHDCYIVMQVIHNVYRHVQGTLKDYISTPKSNGYMSLHTSVRTDDGFLLKFKIRTIDMNHIAKYGIISSIVSNDNIEAVGNQSINVNKWIDNITEMGIETSDSIEFINNIKSEFTFEQIYVFTHNRDIIPVPIGSTVLDFAYHIHTDIGNHCSSATVDGIEVGIDTELHNGQMVAIKTDPNIYPNPSWLDFVISYRARSSIKNSLKEKRVNEIIALGKEILTSAINNYDIKLQEEDIIKNLHIFGIEHLDKLYERIGKGECNINILLNKISGNSLGSKNNLVLFNEENTINAKFADCCNPIPDDEIFGFLHSEQGLVIHRKTCKHYKSLKTEKYKYFEINWGNIPDDKRFVYTISLEVEDVKGVLASITYIISLSNINIEDISCSNKYEQNMVMHFKLSIKNRKELDQLIDKLSNIKYILDINMLSSS